MKNEPLAAPLPPEAPASAAAVPVPGLATQAHAGTPQYGGYGHPFTEPTPKPAPDHRAEGGNVFDLRNEQTTL